jgi:hypothetical protein
MRESAIVPPDARLLRVVAGSSAGRAGCAAEQRTFTTTFMRGVRHDCEEPPMKPSTLVTIAFLGLLSALQLTRFLLGWEVVVNGIAIPTWVSAVASVVAGGLALLLWRDSRR